MLSEVNEKLNNSAQFIYISIQPTHIKRVSQVPLEIRNPLANAIDTRDTNLIPGSERAPEGGHGNPLQYSCLENPMHRGAWWAAVHGVTKSRA